MLKHNFQYMLSIDTNTRRETVIPEIWVNILFLKQTSPPKKSSLYFLKINIQVRQD